MELKDNNSIIKYLCMDTDASCVYHKVKEGSTFLTCEYLSKDTNLHCESKVCNVNRLVVDFKRVAKDLNFDVNSIFKS